MSGSSHKSLYTHSHTLFGGCPQKVWQILLGNITLSHIPAASTWLHQSAHYNIHRMRQRNDTELRTGWTMEYFKLRITNSEASKHSSSLFQKSILSNNNQESTDALKDLLFEIFHYCSFHEIINAIRVECDVLYTSEAMTKHSSYDEDLYHIAEDTIKTMELAAKIEE